MRLCRDRDAAVEPVLATALRAGSPDQRPAPVPERIVNAFHGAGTPVELPARRVPGRRQGVVGAVAIRVGRAPLPTVGQEGAQRAQRRERAVRDHVGEDLAAVARHRGPQPDLMAERDAQFVQLYRVLGQVKQAFAQEAECLLRVRDFF